MEASDVVLVEVFPEESVVTPLDNRLSDPISLSHLDSSRASVCEGEHLLSGVSEEYAAGISKKAPVMFLVNLGLGEPMFVTQKTSNGF